MKFIWDTGFWSPGDRIAISEVLTEPYLSKVKGLGDLETS